ncbi:MAG: hypothetical protein ACFFC7_33295 [Candidatus Hermodarchaeota archaeon]
MRNHAYLLGLLGICCLLLGTTVIMTSLNQLALGALSTEVPGGVNEGETYSWKVETLQFNGERNDTIIFSDPPSDTRIRIYEGDTLAITILELGDPQQANITVRATVNSTSGTFASAFIGFSIIFPVYDNREIYEEIVANNTYQLNESEDLQLTSNYSLSGDLLIEETYSYKHFWLSNDTVEFSEEITAKFIKDIKRGLVNEMYIDETRWFNGSAGETFETLTYNIVLLENLGIPSFEFPLTLIGLFFVAALPLVLRRRK